jgi:hypothetical protein
MPSVYVYPEEFDRRVEILTRKLEEIATRAGLPESELETLESTLAALPPFSRDRAAIMLEGIGVQAEEAFPAMAFAARYVLRLAREVWDVGPLPAPPTATHALEGSSAR